MPRRDPIDDVALEELAATAWCREKVRAGAWVLRAADGFTARANAVAVLDDGVGDGAGTPLGERIDAVERFYAERGLPARFELADGDRHAAFADVLLRRGYEPEAAEDGSWWRAPLRTLRSVAPPNRDGRVVISDAPSQEWFELWWPTLGRPETEREAALELLWELEGRCGFAAHITGGELVGVGLARIDGPWLGIYALGVRADRLRRGSGRRVVGALATWGIAHAAHHAYTVVPDARPAAVQLFETLRFSPGARFRFLRRDLR